MNPASLPLTYPHPALSSKARRRTVRFWLVPFATVLLARVHAADLPPAAGPAAGPVLEFLQPTNKAIFSTTDEVPIMLRAFAPDDLILSADVLADGRSIGEASFCCALCPCAHPLPGQELILQIPEPRENGLPFSRPWKGWTNVPAGVHQLSARATTQNGTKVEAAAVAITVLDRTLRIHLDAEGNAVLVIPQGSMGPGGYDLEASEDLVTWTRLGPFEPGNVAAFYFDHALDPVRKRARFYRSVYVP